MDKQALREAVWDDLAASGVARFPFPPQDRIPNFAGADAAADRLAGLDAWQDAAVIKANPDAPQLPVRRRALDQGKTVYMAVPRLSAAACFLKLAPESIHDTDAAATVSSMAEYGTPVTPDDVAPLDLIVSGSVVVNEDGARIGKGKGYSDLEYGLLAECGLVDDATPVVTTVHGRQVRDASWPVEAHDVPLEYVITPERTIETATPHRRPDGIDWAALDDERLAAMPALAARAP
jgi:5-formyltetrahydrofolate cyclo-ligase